MESMLPKYLRVSSAASKDTCVDERAALVEDEPRVRSARRWFRRTGATALGAVLATLSPLAQTAPPSAPGGVVDYQIQADGCWDFH